MMRKENFLPTFKCRTFLSLSTYSTFYSFVKILFLLLSSFVALSFTIWFSFLQYKIKCSQYFTKKKHSFLEFFLLETKPIRNQNRKTNTMQWTANGNCLSGITSTVSLQCVSVCVWLCVYTFAYMFVYNTYRLGLIVLCLLFEVKLMYQLLFSFACFLPLTPCFLPHPLSASFFYRSSTHILQKCKNKFVHG